MIATFKKPLDPEKDQREVKPYEKKEIRRNSRSRLQEIRNIISEPQTAHVEHDLCKKAGIILQAQSFSLDEESKYRPIFFSSYKDELNDLTEPGYDPYEYNEKWHKLNQAGSLSLFLEDYVTIHDPKGVPGSYYTS